MKEKAIIAQRVEQSMASLDAVERALAPAFFYSRLEARMEAELLGKSDRYAFLENMKLCMLLLLIVLVFNGFSLVLLGYERPLPVETAWETLSREYFMPSNEFGY
ncbi:hypothetical protein [Roseivirga sp. UBA838]|uniref:hypothetical protein n=1 Tax=Roseivirga sp. UBA838 TaxID=1947393 RepID=UPI00257B8916|nr:hypothetical protein [Roseivirga sp. UBA838]|tara:strand:+ start:19533 stop:19847 length:315 start_codon:yes stop_codon:yes gene_type:complete